MQCRATPSVSAGRSSGFAPRWALMAAGSARWCCGKSRSSSRPDWLSASAPSWPWAGRSPRYSTTCMLPILPPWPWWWSSSARPQCLRAGSRRAAPAACHRWRRSGTDEQERIIPTMHKPLILVADDHADVRQALSLLLRDSGYDVATAASPGEALSMLRQSPPDLVLLDLNYQRDTTSGAEGLRLLKEIRAQHSRLPVVILTGWATVSLAVEAMQLGAQDFLEKPWENTRVRTIVAQHLAAVRARAQVRRLEEEGRLTDVEEDGPVHRSRAMREVLTVAGRVAASDVPVLLTGESGTGKSLLARWIHRHSPRSKGPFVGVNLGGLAETLFESELFGHIRGAFTDARSDR